MKKFLFLFFFLGFFPLSAQASTFFEQTGENGYVEPILPGRSFTWNSQGEIIGRSTLAAFDTGYFPATTTQTRYIKDIKLKLKQGNPHDYVFDMVVWCQHPFTNHFEMGRSTNSFNVNDLTNTFEIYTFHMPPNFCDLSINSIGWYAVGLGFNGFPAEVHIAATDVPTVVGFGVGDGRQIIRNSNYQIWIQVEDGPPVPEGLTPVLIVPGMLGTELWNGNDLIWADLAEMKDNINDDKFLTDNLSLNQNGQSILPIQLGAVIEKELDLPVLNVNIFEDLVLDLINIKNYAPDQDLFFFPYDWRQDLNLTKDQLKLKIDFIKSHTGSDKVDIVAHSMGGLLVKDYLNTYGNTSVEKLIFIGTPHLGAPKAGKVLLEGDSFNIPLLDSGVMKNLSVNSPAAYELLPNEKYFETFVGYLKKTKPSLLAPEPPVMDYEQTKAYLLNERQLNSYIYNLAEDFFAKNLEDIDFSGIEVNNIVGCKNPTYGGFLLYKDNSIGSLKWTSGDTTVPMISADYINIPWTNKYYVKSGDHAELPSTNGVRELVLDILSGQAPSLSSNISGTSAFCNFKGKETVWKSPVDVHIYDNQGRHTGPMGNNIVEYGIPGVSYDIIRGEKFIFMPTDEGQIYNINAIGQMQGSFDLLISDVENGNKSNTQVFNDVPIATSTPIIFEISNESIDNQIQVDNLNKLADAQLSGEEILDLTPPETSLLITGTPGNNGWYKSSVQVSLNATDDLSGVMVTKYRLNGGNFADYSTPIFVNTEGVSSLEYYSVDNAGNNEQEQVVSFTIDKTAPEFTVKFNILTKDFEFGAVDNIDPNPAILCTSVQCTATDSTGNVSVLKFEKKLPLTNTKNLLLKSISHNGLTTNFDSNVLSILYSLSSGNITDISQTELIKNQQIANILYSKKLNQSVYSDWSKGAIPTISKYTGLKYIQLETNNNKIKINLK